MPVKPKEPTPDQLRVLHANWNKSTNWLAGELGVHFTVVKRWREEYDSADDEFSERIAIANEEKDPEKLWKYFELLHDQFVQTQVVRHERIIPITDPGPIMVVWMADMHLGSIYTKMRKLRQDLETVRDTDGVYCIFGGDWIENTTSSRAYHGAHHTNMVTTQGQRLLMEWAAGIVDGSLLAWYTGNHEGRTQDDTGVSFVREIAEKVDVPYMGHVGFLDLQFRDVNYRVLCAHKGRGGGQDKTRPAKKLMDEWGDADVVFTAHKHMIASSEEYVRMARRGFAAAGTYKPYDDWAISNSLPPATTEMPGAILYPEKKQVIMAFDAFEMVDIFTRERRHYLSQQKKAA